MTTVSQRLRRWWHSAAEAVAVALLAGLALLAGTKPGFADDRMAFWDVQRRGANYFNETPTPTWFQHAADAGIAWVRLAYDKWPATERDFLIGSADQYDGLVPEDLARLRQVLDWADAAGLKVVIAPLSLPGMRWRQNNNGDFDGRIWQDRAYWDQSARFWRDLASALREHPAVVAYNIVNEPAPEFGTGAVESLPPGEVAGYRDWQAGQAGTARDLAAFYRQVVAAIRENDPETPIMVDGGWYASAPSLAAWPAPLDDPRTLYAFHMYEPYAFTSGRNFREERGFTYPGTVPFGEGPVDWDAAVIETFLAPVFDWAEANGLPPTRIAAAEFGCMRRNTGCADYLADVIGLLNHRGVHWAFYSFREDEYDGYDYEVGSGPLGWRYWQAVDRGEDPTRPYAPNPLWDAVLCGLHRCDGG